MRLSKLLRLHRVITLSRLTKSPKSLLKYAIVGLRGGRDDLININGTGIKAWIVSKLLDAVENGLSVSVSDGEVKVGGVSFSLSDYSDCSIGLMLTAVLAGFTPVADAAGRYFTNGDVKFRHVNSAVVEVFNYRLYDFNIPHLDGDWLIDIGANVGDSAIWFAKRGFRVLAVEPVPSAYEEMLDNLMLNDVAGRVKAINAAYSLSHPAVKVNDYDCLESTVTASTSTTTGTVTVPGFNLRKLLEYTDWKARVLKVDCEGCEVELVTDPMLPWFTDVLIEAPNRGVHKVLRGLGFRLVKVNKHPSNPDASVYHYAK